jgi:hypothetical protein
LDELYARLLAPHANAGYWQLTRTFFQWLACANKPLSIEEIGAASKIDVENTSMKRKVNADKIRSVISRCCSPLVKFDELAVGITTVMLIHASVKDYLL